MRAYHFLKHGYGLEAVRRRRLKIARISALNDPFEFMSFSLRRRGDRQLFEHWRDGMDKDHGLLCFSSRSTNPVQWSHYAENHTGVCLGFDIPDELIMEVKTYKARLAFQSFQVVENKNRRLWT